MIQRVINFVKEIEMISSMECRILSPRGSLLYVFVEIHQRASVSPCRPPGKLRVDADLEIRLCAVLFFFLIFIFIHCFISVSFNLAALAASGRHNFIK